MDNVRGDRMDGMKRINIMFTSIPYRVIVNELLIYMNDITLEDRTTQEQGDPKYSIYFLWASRNDICVDDCWDKKNVLL